MYRKEDIGRNLVALVWLKPLGHSCKHVECLQFFRCANIIKMSIFIECKSKKKSLKSQGNMLNAYSFSWCANIIKMNTFSTFIECECGKDL